MNSESAAAGDATSLPTVLLLVANSKFVEGSTGMSAWLRAIEDLTKKGR